MIPLLLLLAACGPGAAPTEAAVAAVTQGWRTAPVEAARHRPSVELTGTLTAVASVQLGFDVPGRIEALYVQRGRAVRAGERVARLDASLAAAQLAQGEAALAGAEAQLAAGEAAWGRAQKLKEAGALSEQQYADAEGQILAARAGVEQARAGVRLARTHLGLHTLVSPIDGVVTNGPDNVGLMTGAGAPLFVIEDLSALQVKATAPESAAWVREGLPATVLGQSPGVAAGFPGRVARVIPSLDPATRRIPVEVRVDAPPAELRANAFARVRIEGDAEIDAWSVPAEAVVARPDFSVFVLPAPTAEPVQVPVSIVAEDGGRRLVTGALNAGAEVILSPPPTLGASGGGG